MTTQPAAQVQPIEVPPLTPIVVLAHLLQNTLGALGLTALCIGLALGAGVEFNSYRWAGIVGLCWWGLINWWRFSEEGRAAIRAAYWKAQYEACDKEADGLDALLLERDRTNSALQAQLVARKNFVPTTPEAPDPILRDAETLVRLRYSDGARVSRRLMAERGWTEDRYRAALDILRMARIVGGPERQPDWAQYDSAATALVALATPPRQPESEAFFTPTANGREGGE